MTYHAAPTQPAERAHAEPAPVSEAVLEVRRKLEHTYRRRNPGRLEAEAEAEV